MPALTWMDRRAVAEAAKISEVAGSPADPSFYLAKAMWIIEHKQELLDRIRYFMPCPEFVAYSFSGVAHAVLPDPYYERYIWSESLISRLGLPSEKFPTLVNPGRIVGQIRKDVAHMTGLPALCKVASGLPDFMAAQLGSATVSPGIALDRTGSSEALNLCADRPFPDSRLLSLPHSVSGLWNVSGGVSTSGSAVSWLDRLFSKIEGPSPILENSQDLESIGPGSAGLTFLPYLAGERAPLWMPDLRGAFVGLDLGHGRNHLSRALLESVCYALREVKEMLEDSLFPIRAVHLTGGTSANAFWVRLKADILNMPMTLPLDAEAELAGSAALALTASGTFSDISSASLSLYRVGEVVEPDPAMAGAYDEYYGRFLEIRGRLCGVGSSPA
jgi:xylulokinase